MQQKAIRTFQQVPVRVMGGKLDLVTLQQTKQARIYNFIEFDDKRQLYIHKQLENRNGKILMRSKVRMYNSFD